MGLTVCRSSWLENDLGAGQGGGGDGVPDRARLERQRLAVGGEDLHQAFGIIPSPAALEPLPVAQQDGQALPQQVDADRFELERLVLDEVGFRVLGVNDDDVVESQLAAVEKVKVGPLKACRSELVLGPTEPAAVAGGSVG